MPSSNLILYERRQNLSGTPENELFLIGLDKSDSSITKEIILGDHRLIIRVSIFELKWMIFMASNETHDKKISKLVLI